MLNKKSSSLQQRGAFLITLSKKTKLSYLLTDQRRLLFIIVPAMSTSATSATVTTVIMFLVALALGFSNLNNKQNRQHSYNCTINYMFHKRKKYLIDKSELIYHKSFIMQQKNSREIGSFSGIQLYCKLTLQVFPKLRNVPAELEQPLL